MSRPPKPFSVLKNEKKSHRTKAELKQRQSGEEALSTGVALRERPEVKSNVIAHKEFRRLNSLLKEIKKNDAIYETIINRYCLLIAECTGLEEQKNNCNEELKELFETHAAGEVDFITYMDTKEKISKRYLDYDKKIMDKRKMLFDIEKENIMTIAAAIRSIPKKQEKASNPLLEALKKNG